MVPKGWSVFRLEDIVIRTQLGTTERGMSEDPLTTLIPLIKMGNLGWGSVNFNKVEYIEQSLINDSFLLKKGDFLFNTRNTPDLVGKSAVWDEDYTATFDNNINRIVFNKKVYTNFIAYYLNTGKGKSAIQSLPAGSTSVAAIYWKDLKNIQLLLPSLGEQQKIVQILSTWDKSIVVTGKLLTNSHRQKKALMQQLLTGKKRLLDENGVRFSGEWEYTIFGNLGDTYTGLTGKTKEDFGAGKPYIPYINIFKNSRIDIQNLEYVQVNDDERQSVVKYGDIFFTTSSETPEEVGMSSVLLEEVSEVFLNSFCFGFRLNNFETLIPKYARYLFRSEHVRRQISTLGQGATRYNLSKRQLIKLELKLPCVEEQQKIAAVLSAADAEISTLEKKLACLRDEKKALMQQLLTGKRRVKVDEAVAE
ncbi:TPA: restriction endonuclease subunit S [Escherichia coli]|uniref:restriction endonuclease subunit S n=2 Tax=Escherichia coli TaxID=562 RepID=UPI000DD5B52F|nr:restriction endonuclease subunit S [Escherichia coli]EJX1955162.1 restriction endonuclease subunit S [Salmonella enterica]EFJ3011888.1 restriction endonuclease subunit S [Escherichia coli]EIE7461247.1 restriction endonuclease subunit S [Escherichia coli]EJX3558826.1 restriction endonuclease subunit S [Salmonella enterica]ELO4036072.1 restriction endonuclease subunit S [Escherichia coli]